ncbi:MAG TPA: hypothetical protein PLC79_08250, partial [Phycisphaerae bacterium]|nr:hypothetical protein [Phycisphaerae bacterium]
DLLPTFLDAAGAAFSAKDFDGQSLLGPIRGQADSWRPYIDLEHSRCYKGSEPWNALTDGRTKYIFYAATGREELFDLDKDPGELHDLAPDPQEAARLAAWRSRMVEHLSERGEAFVKDGRLVAPRKDMLYSPRFPQPAEDAGASPSQRPGRQRTPG